MATDIVNDRVNIAQAELQKRAKRLEKIVARPGKKSAEFQEGVKLLNEMIHSQSKLLDIAVFDAPKTALEQNRNLMLLTGGMNENPIKGIKYATDAMDSMLDILDDMSNQR